MKKVFLSLGANIGDKRLNIAKAVRKINDTIGQIVDLSGIYESEPWGFESEDKFLNMVVVSFSNLTPHEVLRQCQDIEDKLGRIRDNTNKYSSRIIDIDIIFYDDVVLSDEDLTIPHPQMQNRKFVLMPLNEVSSDYVHPVLDRKISELLAECTDSISINQLTTLM